VLTRIADYVLDYRIDSALAYETAQYCLLDTLRLRQWRRSLPRLHKIARADRAGTVVVRNGAKVPGTSYQLDPVQAAFNSGRLSAGSISTIRGWRRNGAILRTISAAFLRSPTGCRAIGSPRASPLVMRDVLTAMIKAHEIQGVIALENSFNKVASITSCW
jgi:2-methylcitrate dehydratase